MKRIKIPGLVDTITVDDAEMIRRLAADERIDRDFTLRPPLNGLRLKHILRVLSYKGIHFPHMTARTDEARKVRHEQLWEIFNSKAAEMAEGPDELDGLARWVRRETEEQEAGVLVQQLIGQFFKSDFRATPESWQAALVLHEAAGSKHPLKRIWWRLTGKVRGAKQLLGSTVDDDLIAMHGIAIAAHNLVATVSRLRIFYADEAVRRTITPEIAVERSLNAPPVVYRQALSDGAAAGCPYSKSALFLLKLQDANKGPGTNDMIFMTGTWSRCPAEQWIPAVISGLWKRVMGS